MFDLNSQSGVMVILASVRASELSTAEKNEIRDLVFLYTNGGRDQSVKIALEQKLTAHNIKPVAAKKTVASNGPILPFGSSRPVPTFKAPPVVVAQITPAVPTPVQPAAVPELSTPPVPVQSYTPAPTQVSNAIPPQVVGTDSVVVSQAPAFVAPASVPVPPVVTPPLAPPVVSPLPTDPVPTQAAPQVMSQAQTPLPSTIQPATSSVVSPIVPNPVDSTPIAPPQTLPPNSPVPPSAPASSSTSSDYLERIKQIKLAVNSKVGNPVNLVDINNEVGREYMNALLEAMKKLSAGAESEMPIVMSRLEAAYQEVEDTLKNRDLNNQFKSEPVPISKVTAGASVVKSAIPPADEAIQINPVLNNPITPGPAPSFSNQSNSDDISQVTAKSAVPAGLNAKSATSPAELISNRPIPLSPLPDIGVSPASNVVLDMPGLVNPVVVAPPTPLRNLQSASSFSNRPLSVNESPSPQLNTPSVANRVPASIPRPPSLADHAPVKTPADLPDAASINSTSTGDPLFSKEVDDGLEQLLSDWILFKKSGFLGRGPKGREHPLYKKISSLPVPLLLAGRFDGATQEVRQSITDYMNGWRYEQGIIYEQGENFDHYLRRVIRHILDLQKKRKG